MYLPRTAFLLIPLVSACATFPALDSVPEPQATQATYPALMPIDELLAQIPPPPTTDPAAEVEARAAALRDRAAALQAIQPSG